MTTSKLTNALALAVFLAVAGTTFVACSNNTSQSGWKNRPIKIGNYNVTINLDEVSEEQHEALYNKLADAIKATNSNLFDRNLTIVVGVFASDISIYSGNLVEVNVNWLLSSSVSVTDIKNRLTALLSIEPPVTVVINVGSGNTVNVSLALFAKDIRWEMEDKLHSIFNNLAMSPALAGIINKITTISIVNSGADFTITPTSMSLNANWLTSQSANSISNQLIEAMKPEPVEQDETRTFNVPTFGGRLKGQQVTVEFRAGSAAQRDDIFNGIKNAWEFEPMNEVVIDDEQQSIYNTVLDRGLKIIVVNPEDQEFPIERPDNHTVSYKVNHIVTWGAEDFSGNLNFQISNLLFSMARMQAKDTIRMAKAPIDRGSG